MDESIAIEPSKAGVSSCALDPTKPTIDHHSDGESIPLSYAQQRLWFLHQMAPDSPVYNMALVIRFASGCESSVLKKSLNALMLRHSSLSTVFPSRSGNPTQVIRSAKEVDLSVVDLSKYSPSVREEHFATLTAEARARPFDLARGPLHRWTLYRFSDSDYRLYLVLHHIIADGWALTLLAQDLRALYLAEISGLPEPPRPAISYVDFTVWQRNRLESGAMHAQIDWWKKRLSSSPEVLNLPYDHPRRSVQSHLGATQSFTLPEPLLEALKSSGKMENATLFMTLLAAFYALLFRYTGQTDLVVGTPIANRTRTEFESVVGCFVNTLVIRVDTSGDPRFHVLLRRVRDATLEAFARQDVPFEKLVEILQPDRTGARNPLFEVFFTLQNTPGETAEYLFDVGADEVVMGTAKFDLSVALAETSNGLVGAIEYSTELFDHATIRRLIGHYRNILTAVVQESSKPITLLSLMTEAEIRQFEAWNQTRDDVPITCIHTMFETQVRATPGAIALVADNECLTYQELDIRSNRLANRLRNLGVRQGILVGICLERSAELVVSLYAVLKAGGAYVPIDPIYPQDRIALMLSSPSVAVLITTDKANPLIQPENCITVLLDSHRESIDAEPSRKLPEPLEPDSLAYVIHTSGSTGEPKASGVTHRNFVNTLIWFLREFHIGPADKVIVSTSFSFDLTQKNFFAPHAVGATVYLDRSQLFDPANILWTVKEHKITLLNCTPSMMYSIVDSVPEKVNAGLSSVRCLFLGGEDINIKRLWSWISSDHFNAEIINTYGPTECSDIATFQRIESADQYLENPVPIGKPISNVSLFVLDRELNRVPIGVIGELYIGGDGVGKGYLTDPALNNLKFIRNPFSRTRALMYKTGDLVKFRPTGELEFVGRGDDQIKLRGFRVELGEIEAAIRRHPAVKDAAVVPRGEAENRSLVAYVVPDRVKAGPLHRFDRLQESEQSQGHSYIELPNGLLVFHQNRSETEFLYRELFEQDAYLRHGIRLSPRACIFDVGANIGLFAVYVRQRCPAAQIFAFEPIPPVFETLSLNVQLYDLAVRLFPYGLAAEDGVADFHYYPHVSIISGRFADEVEDREVVRKYLVARGKDTPELSLRETDLADILAERLKTERFTCNMRTLSQVIREENVTKIDLLKIDVEKSELDVLRGLEESHWTLVNQVVVEVHDIDKTLDKVLTLLNKNGFKTNVEQDPVLRDTNIYSVYATRPEHQLDIQEFEIGTVWSSKARLSQEILDCVRGVLPSYMVPSRVVFLEEMPSTPSGKLDRKALPESDSNSRGSQDYIGARTDLERAIVRIWSEILRLDTVGVRDNFFELGGHSLLATQIVARMRDAFNAELPLKDFFERPTVEGLALNLATRMTDPAIEVTEIQQSTAVIR